MNKQDIKDLMTVLLIVAITFGPVVYLLKRPIEYTDSKHQTVKVYCHGQLLRIGELESETSTFFIVGFFESHKYPKPIYTYKLDKVYYD